MLRIARPVSIALLALSLVSGCGSPEEPTRAVKLTGTVAAPGLDGTVTVQLYHAWALSGDLRHPLQFIEEFRARPNQPFEHAFDYPEARGEGLVVYAWLDTDGDEVLCTPSFREELAGLTVVDDFPADTVAANIVLTEPCRGPDWFYPAAK